MRASDVVSPLDARAISEFLAGPSFPGFPQELLLIPRPSGPPGLTRGRSRGRATMEKSMSFEDLKGVAGTLSLDGRPLEPPRLLPRGPADGDAPVVAPVEFVKLKDPGLQRRLLEVDEIRLPKGASLLLQGAKLGTSFARVVHNVLEPGECASLLAQANDYGYVPLENRFRCMLECPELAAYLLEVLRPHLPERLCHGHEYIEEINPRFRFTCYLPEQEFAKHADPFWVHPPGHPKAGVVSRATVLLYLNDVPDEYGGGTAFVGEHRVVCQPRGGSVLIFSQDLLHEGSIVTGGLKYFARTELMFREDTEAKDLEDLIDSI